MQIFVNGQITEVAETIRMSELLAQLDLGGERIAVEVNEELVPRSLFGEHNLAAQDRVEIIHAVGGG